MPVAFTLRTSSFGFSYIFAVAHNGSDLWVAGGNDQKIATSPNGITWTQRASSFTFNAVLGVAHNKVDLWVAVGDGGQLATSPDGFTWTQRDEWDLGTPTFNAVAHGAGLWVAVHGDGWVATSPDGFTWTSRAASGKNFLSVAHNGVDLWVAVGATWAGQGLLATSSDGITWTQRTSPFGTSVVRGIAYNGSNLWVAAGDQGKLATSPDGITWTLRSSSFNSNTVIKGLVYDSVGGSWVAGGSEGSIAISTNGISWTEQFTPFSNGEAADGAGITGIAHDGVDRFVAVAVSGFLGTGEQSNPPVADFTATPLIGTEPLSVAFTDLSTAAPDSWAWDFEDDGIVDSNDQNPVYEYLVPGIYTVRLTATSGSGSDVEVKTDLIEVQEKPLFWTAKIGVTET